VKKPDAARPNDSQRVTSTQLKGGQKSHVQTVGIGSYQEEKEGEWCFRCPVEEIAEKCKGSYVLNIR
jgi:hypothetical protein